MTLNLPFFFQNNDIVHDSVNSFITIILLSALILEPCKLRYVKRFLDNTDMTKPRPKYLLRSITPLLPHLYYLASQHATS